MNAEIIVRKIFDAYNKIDKTKTEIISLTADDAHHLALAFCSTVKALEELRQLLIDSERKARIYHDKIQTTLEKI